MVLYSAAVEVDGGGAVVAAGTVFGEVVVWRWDWGCGEAEVLGGFRGHEGSVFGVGFGGGVVVSCSDDRTIRVWDVGGVEDAHYGQYGASGRETGFLSSEERGGEERGGEVACAMGHASRIWGVKVVVFQGERWVFSFGEDCTVQRWKLDAGTLRHRDTRTLHAGKHIWSSAVQTTDEGVRIATGGGDGRISLLDVHLASNANGTKEYDVEDILRTLGICEGVPRKKKEMMRHFVFCRAEEMLGVTTLGRVLRGIVTGDDVSWAEVPADEETMGELSSCSQMKAAGPGVAILGTSRGFLFLADICVGKICSDLGAIQEIFPLDTRPETTLLIGRINNPPVLLTLTATTVTSQQPLTCLDARFIVTSAAILNGTLILGSRQGYISLLHPPNWTQTTTWTPRVNEGISHILPLPQSHFATCSLDGFYRVYQYGDSWQLTLLHETHSPFGQNFTGAFIHKNEVLFYGYSGTNLVLWNESSRREISSIPCGGAHRALAISPLSSTFLVGYNKASRFHLHRTRSDVTVLNHGSHGREIRAVDYLDTQNVNGRIFASAGEDTRVRIWTTAGIQAELKHTSGVHCVKFIGDRLITAGGVEELFVWKVSARNAPISPSGLCIRREGVLLDKSLNGDLRITSVDASLCKGGFMVSASCSNSTFKTYLYKKGEFERVAEGGYTGACIMHIRHLDMSRDEKRIVTAATDGRVCVWVDKRKEYVLVGSVGAHQSCVKGIDVVRWMGGWIVLSGGDDGALVCSLVRGDGVEVLGGVGGAHAAAINGVAVVEKGGVVRACTVGNDQRLGVWRVGEGGVVREGGVGSGVADAGGVVCFPGGVCVVGVGVEVWAWA